MAGDGGNGFTPTMKQPYQAPATQTVLKQVRIVPQIRVQQDQNNPVILLFLGTSEPELGAACSVADARKLAQTLNEYADRIERTGSGRIIIANPSTPLPPLPSPGGPHAG